jgi:hypothetical protein
MKKNDSSAQSVTGTTPSATRNAAPTEVVQASPPPSAERRRSSTPIRGIAATTSGAQNLTTTITASTAAATTTSNNVRQSPPRIVPQPTVEALTSVSPPPKIARKRARTTNSVPNSPPPVDINKSDAPSQTNGSVQASTLSIASSSALPVVSQRASRRSAEKAAKKAAKK